MTVNRGLFVSQLGKGGTTPLEARRALGGLFIENTPGTPRTGLLEPSTPNVVTGSADMSYDVVPLTAVINRSATEGVYVFTLHGTTNLGTSAAPGGSDKRWDLIWVKQNDPDKSDTSGGTLSNDGMAGVVVGSPSPAPSKPTSGVPAGALVIAEALVSAGATATNQSAVTINNVFPYAGFKGAPLWVRDATERGSITPHVHQEIYNMSTGFVERWRGSSWESTMPMLRHAYFRITQTGVPSATVWGPGMPSQDAQRSVNGGFVFFSENDWLSVTQAGVYTIDFMVQLTTGFGPGGFVALENFSGQTLASTQGTANAGGISASATVFLNPGTQIPGGVVKTVYYQNSGNTANATVYVHVTKVQ